MGLNDLIIPPGHEYFGPPTAPKSLTEGGGSFSTPTSIENTAVGPGHPDYQDVTQEQIGGLGGIRSIMPIRPGPMPPHFGLWPKPRPIQPKVPWEEFGEQLGGYGETLGGYGETLGGFGEQMTGFGEQMGGYQDALGGFNEQIGGFGKQFETVNNKLDSMEKGIAGLDQQLQTQQQPQQVQQQQQYQNPFSSPFGFSGFGGLGSLFGRRY